MHIAMWAALACLALAIRPLVYGITPLLPQLQAELASPFSGTALLVSVPVFAMGVASLLTPALTARLGIAASAAFGLALMLIAGVARAELPDLPALVVASVPLGIGAGICGVLLPMIVKSSVPAGLAASATSVYTAGLQLGGALTASLAVPLAVVGGGWRPAFVAIGGLSALAVAGWLVLRRLAGPGGQALEVAEREPPGSGAGGRRWLPATVAAFALLVLLFQGLNAWLPAAYVEAGWSEATAGALLAVLVFAQLPGTLLAGWLADRAGRGPAGRRGGSRRPYLVVPAVALAVAIALLVAVPELAFGWALVAGLALGFIAPITLVIALDFGATGAEVGRSSGLVLGTGYIVASLSPLAMGVARDASGSFGLGLAGLAGLALVLAATALVLPNRRDLRPAAGLA